MDHSTYGASCERSTRSLELRAFHAVVIDGGQIPLDVAAKLMANGMDVNAYQERLEKLRDHQ